MKKYLLSVCVIFFSVASAFTVKKLSPREWRFTGNECEWSQRVNPQKYIQESLSCSPGESHFCKIVALDDNGYPSIPNPSDLRTYLINDFEVLPLPVSGVIYLEDE